MPVLSTFTVAFTVLDTFAHFYLGIISLSYKSATLTVNFTHTKLPHLLGDDDDGKDSEEEREEAFHQDSGVSGFSLVGMGAPLERAQTVFSFSKVPF